MSEMATTNPEENGASKCTIPIAVSPIRTHRDIQSVPYPPLRCRTCSAALIPFSRVDFTAKIWIYPICFQLNHCPPHYNSISETNVPCVLYPQNTTVEYTLPSPSQPTVVGNFDQSGAVSGQPSPSVFVFVLDTCMIQEDFGVAKSALKQAIGLLPENALVGFLSFGTQAKVHELGFSDLTKVYVFMGDKEISKDQILEHLGLGVAGRRTPAGGFPMGNSGVSRFLLPASECEITINSLLDELQTEPVQPGRRQTGVALSVATGLLEAFSSRTGARIVVFIGGPCSEGLGTVNSQLPNNGFSTQLSFSPGAVNSQLPNNGFPTIMSFSPSPDHGGSALHAQNGDDRKHRYKWSITEDLILISAWLITSKDPVVGNEQKAESFWKRIASYYNTSPKVVGLVKREPTHCKQRWGKINKGVYNFVESYDAATKQKTNDQNEEDVLKAAHEIYFNEYKVKFSLEHAWRELRNNKKWCESCESSQQSSGLKRKRVGEDHMPSVSGEDEAMAGPIGDKAAKAKAKRPMGTEGKELQEFQKMWELKQQNLVLKERLSKNKLLDSLLAKTEPLSELEVALKNKLITEMLSMSSTETRPNRSNRLVTEMEGSKMIVSALSTKGIKLHLPSPPREEKVEVVHISDGEEDDLVELSEAKYIRKNGWLIRVEEVEEDITPEFKRLAQMMHEKDKKLREKKFKTMKARTKQKKSKIQKG